MRDWTLPDDADSAWAGRAEFNEVSRRAVIEDLTPVRCRGALAPGEVGCISVIRNEASRLPLFLDHHRRLGVDRFFVVDNGSTDGSQDILRADPAVDVFYTEVKFADACAGLYWANGLAHGYCRDRWVARLDADELLVFDGCGEQGLPQLAAWLAAHGLDRVLAIMIDVYSSGRFVGAPAEDLSEILARDCWFDSEGYEGSRIPAGWKVTGGARHRLFNQGAETYPHLLSKYPFFHMAAEVAVYDHHLLWPYDRSGRRPLSALVHTKLLGDLGDRSAVFMREQQHGWNSEGYRIIHGQLQAKPDLSAYHDRSRRYRGPKSLVRHGLMQPIDWRS